jgi:hypothetical protein
MRIIKSKTLFTCGKYFYLVTVEIEGGDVQRVGLAEAIGEAVIKAVDALKPE